MEENKNEIGILILDYIFKNEIPKFDKIIIQNKAYDLKDVDDKPIKIRFNDIESEYGTKIIEFSLVFTNKTETFYFEITPGENYGYIFNAKNGITRDIKFLEKINEIKISNDNLVKTDMKRDNNRLLLINFNNDYEFLINGTNYTRQLQTFCDKLSMQVCAVDLKNRILFNKEIFPEAFIPFQLYDDYKDDAKDFLEKIESFMKSRISFNKEKYKEIFIYKNLINIIFLKLNLPTKILENNYNSLKYFTFTYSCCLYYILHDLDEEEKIKELYNYFVKFKKTLENESNLNNYMKIIILIELSIILKEKNDLTKFKNLNFKYYKTKSSESNSPINNAMKFFNDFIDNLNESSPFYYPLLLIDSGIFTYNNDSVYGCGIINDKILKSHLKQIIPEIIIVINDEETLEDEAITNKNLGSIIFNVASPTLSSLKNIEINKTMQDQDLREKIALIIFLTLFHEILGHKKGGFAVKVERVPKSPKIFYDYKKKSILTLVNRNSDSESEKEIKILRKDNSDSGHFLEYFIGECEYGYFSELIEYMILEGINLNFIFDVNLWNEKIEIMRKYIKLKYIIYQYDKKLLDAEKFKNIYEEIQALEVIIKEKNISIDTPQNIITQSKEGIVKNKKIELSSLIKKKKEYKKYENLSYEEMREKIVDSNTPKELRNILIKIILNSFRKTKYL